MSVQLRLPGVDPPQQLTASRKRPSPVFWVRRLRVLRELKPGAEHVIRDIQLKRGLNIVWAPPGPQVDENRLFQNGVPGHTAGKTMFCRLIRYVLGERTFATEATRRRIREKLPTGWVTAEIVVGEESWAVARPFAIGPHSFCLRDAGLEQVCDGTGRLDHQTFVEAVSQAALGNLAARRFPGNDALVRFQHVIPWLTRDQECRYGDFLEWRHSSSDSEVEALTVDERQFVVRTVLGLISEEERLEQLQNARLVADRKEAASRAPLLSHQSEVDQHRVAEALGVALPPLSTGLFGSQAREELQRLTLDLDDRSRQVAETDQRDELRAALEDAVAAEARARRALDEQTSSLDLEKSVLAQLSGDVTAAVLVEAAFPPSREYCGVRMELARQEGCPLAAARPISISEHRAARTAAQELENARRVVQRLEAAVESERRNVADAESVTRQARKEFMLASTAFDEERSRIHQERARLTQIGRLIGHAEQAWEKANEVSELIKRLDAEVAQSYERQELLRHDRREAIERFSATFDYVVRAVLGDHVTGRVETAGRSLSLSVDEHGERDSAAIATIKLLAFDLAGLIESVEGRGGFPRFLLHDGPREADMSADIYDRIFILARELEKCFEGEPSFQYIVTTTTPPPAPFATEPWLRVKLAGMPAHERLLRADL